MSDGVGGEPAAALFDSTFLKRLERLTLEVRRTIASGAQGARQSLAKGPGIEFADHRTYGAGDDLRHIDWHLYARLGRLFVKVHEAERETTVHLVVDTSTSMSFGTPSKLEFAARIAGALGYVALANEDRVAFAGFSDSIGNRFGPVRGKRRAHALFRGLEGLEAAGGTSTTTTLKAIAAAGRPGLVVVLSDWLVEDDWREGLRALVGSRSEVFVIQVLSPEDVSPALDGDVALVDSETGETIGLTVTDAVRARYRRALDEHVTAIESFCLERGIGYVRASSDASFEELVLTTLRRTPLVR